MHVWCALVHQPGDVITGHLVAKKNTINERHWEVTIKYKVSLLSTSQEYDLG